MQLKEKKEYPYLESPTGEMYTSPFFLFSRLELPLEKKGPMEKFSPDLIEKELDEDGPNMPSLMLLYYFGARYYNSDIGVWNRPDPAGQFFNSYGYGGDPINGVDANGEWVFLAYVAAYGAINFGIKAYQEDINGYGDAINAFGEGAALGALTYASAPLAIQEAGAFSSVAGDVALSAALDYSPPVPLGNFTISPTFTRSDDGYAFGAQLVGNFKVNNNLTLHIGQQAGYSEGLFSGIKGFEGTSFGGATYTNSKGMDFSLILNQHVKGNGTRNQKDWVFGFRNGWFGARTSNDLPWTDQWQTAAFEFSFQQGNLGASIGGLIYTGVPDKNSVEKGVKGYEKYDVYTKVTEPEKLTGILYGGVSYKNKGIRIGRNSEAIRNIIQNGAHLTIGRVFHAFDPVEPFKNIPLFPVYKELIPSNYGSYQTESIYSIY